MSTRRCSVCDREEDLRPDEFGTGPRVGLRPFLPDGSLICFECGRDPKYRDDVEYAAVRVVFAPPGATWPKLPEPWEVEPCAAHAIVGCMACRYGEGPLADA